MIVSDLQSDRLNRNRSQPSWNAGSRPDVPQPMLHEKRISFDRFARWTERRVGSPMAFWLALLVIVVWAVTGPFFDWSDTWQLVINTGTTIVTFLMVFLIQATQSRDTRALHLKLDELIRVNNAARNSLLNLEDMSEEEVERVKATFDRVLATPARTN